MSVHIADTTPDAADLWDGIAGHFDSFGQVICEFIDNSVSNFIASTSPIKHICVSLEEKSEDEIAVNIEDTGTGIEDFGPVLRLGDRRSRQTPLNEHGFGLKHALASADPSNERWSVYTRTAEEAKNGTFRVVRAPYSFQSEVHELTAPADGWPGQYNGPGTIVKFTCSRHLFNTIQSGISGNAKFNRCLEYLTEYLGYIYAGVIRAGAAMIQVQNRDPSSPFLKQVGVIEPTFAGFYSPKQGSVEHDLGAGKVTISYIFGEMEKSSHTRYYKRNLSTSGAEIRINGRLIMPGLFAEIWKIEKHPSYNHFLAVIDLQTKHRERLPKTRTSKNGLRSGDDRLEALFEWIRKTHPNPPKELSEAVSERDLVEDLRVAKERAIRAKDKRIQVGFPLFTNLGAQVYADLYLFDGVDAVLYEAKKGIADVQDVYQLLLYWDGAIADGIVPAEGILVASGFSDAVDVVIGELNSRTDAAGNNYNFKKSTWRDEGVIYPKP